MKQIFAGFFICVFGLACNSNQCVDVSSDYTSVADLGNSTFKNYSGGLYPNGSNTIPADYLKNGIAISKKILPLDAQGNNNPSEGKIGFLVLGFSTAAMTGSVFKWIYHRKYPDSPLCISIGAQGGMDINAMLDSNTLYWNNVDQALSDDALTLLQVQIIWISTGDLQSSSLDFPEQSFQLAEKYSLLMPILAAQFPNLKIVFISDRTFAGYINEKSLQALAEPTAYYSSWGVKFFIEKQIGDTTNYMNNHTPFADWGPTLWTNGIKGNKQQYTWNCDDAGAGGIHPTAKGRSKEAIKLFYFFSQHPYTKQFFISQ